MPVARNLSQDGADCIFLSSFAALNIRTEKEAAGHMDGHGTRFKRHSSLAEGKARGLTNEKEKREEPACRRSKSLHYSKSRRSESTELPKVKICLTSTQLENKVLA